MKTINKSAEPIELSNWKEQDKMFRRDNPKWNRVPKEVKDQVHETLMEEQGFICCYCESRITAEDSHIEHFRPMGPPKRPTKYSNLQLDYNNLHCSCLRETDSGEPLHCGHKKSGWFDEELMVSPLSPDCEEKFRFTGNGEIHPRQKKDLSALTTIEKLGLNLPKLKSFRSAAIEVLLDLTSDEIRNILNKNGNGAYPHYYSAIAQVLLDQRV